MSPTEKTYIYIYLQFTKAVWQVWGVFQKFWNLKKAKTTPGLNLAAIPFKVPMCSDTLFLMLQPCLDTPWFKHVV